MSSREALASCLACAALELLIGRLCHDRTLILSFPCIWLRHAYFS